jgi:hypothetical protein
MPDRELPLASTVAMGSAPFVTMRLLIRALLVTCGCGLAGVVMWLAASLPGPGFAVAAVGIISGVAGLIGQIMGFLHGPLPGPIRLLLFHVVDNLAQYRAFTRLLRDQGQSITRTTGTAAENIATVMTEMDITLETLAAAVRRDGADFNRELLISELGRIRAPIIAILSVLQFQDVTQQQFAFLNRLSVILDDHMVRLAGQLGDRQAKERITGFSEMFEQALADCVMASQRDDHHAASGSSEREDAGLKVELF